MRQVRYRAVIALDPDGARPVRPPSRQSLATRMLIPYPRSVAQTGPTSGLSAAADPTRQYLNHTHELMVQAAARCFATEMTWDDELPLHPGDRHVVTITVTDDDPAAFLAGGMRFTLWDGAEVGHGTISRQVFSEYGPCLRPGRAYPAAGQRRCDAPLRSSTAPDAHPASGEAR
jgi:hypothetical protein